MDIYDPESPTEDDNEGKDTPTPSSSSTQRETFMVDLHSVPLPAAPLSAVGASEFQGSFEMRIGKKKKKKKKKKKNKNLEGFIFEGYNIEAEDHLPSPHFAVPHQYPVSGFPQPLYGQSHAVHPHGPPLHSMGHTVCHSGPPLPPSGPPLPPPGPPLPPPGPPLPPLAHAVHPMGLAVSPAGPFLPIPPSGPPPPPPGPPPPPPPAPQPPPAVHHPPLLPAASPAPPLPVAPSSPEYGDPLSPEYGASSSPEYGAAPSPECEAPRSPKREVFVSPALEPMPAETPEKEKLEKEQQEEEEPSLARKLLSKALVNVANKGSSSSATEESSAGETPVSSPMLSKLKFSLKPSGNKLHKVSFQIKPKKSTVKSAEDEQEEEGGQEEVNEEAPARFKKSMTELFRPDLKLNEEADVANMLYSTPDTIAVQAAALLEKSRAEKAAELASKKRSSDEEKSFDRSERHRRDRRKDERDSKGSRRGDSRDRRRIDDRDGRDKRSRVEDKNDRRNRRERSHRSEERDSKKENCGKKEDVEKEIHDFGEHGLKHDVASMNLERESVTSRAENANDAKIATTAIRDLYGGVDDEESHSKSVKTSEKDSSSAQEEKGRVLDRPGVSGDRNIEIDKSTDEKQDLSPQNDGKVHVIEVQSKDGKKSKDKQHSDDGDCRERDSIKRDKENTEPESLESESRDTTDSTQSKKTETFGSESTEKSSKKDVDNLCDNQDKDKSIKKRDRSDSNDREKSKKRDRSDSRDKERDSRHREKNTDKKKQSSRSDSREKDRRHRDEANSEDRDIRRRNRSRSNSREKEVRRKRNRSSSREKQKGKKERRRSRSTSQEIVEGYIKRDQICSKSRENETSSPTDSRGDNRDEEQENQRTKEKDRSWSDTHSKGRTLNEIDAEEDNKDKSIEIIAEDADEGSKDRNRRQKSRDRHHSKHADKDELEAGTTSDSIYRDKKEDTDVKPGISSTQKDVDVEQSSEKDTESKTFKKNKDMVEGQGSKTEQVESSLHLRESKSDTETRKDRSEEGTLEAKKGSAAVKSKASEDVSESPNCTSKKDSARKVRSEENIGCREGSQEQEFARKSRSKEDLLESDNGVSSSRSSKDNVTKSRSKEEVSESPDLTKVSTRNSRSRGDLSKSPDHRERSLGSKQDSARKFRSREDTSESADHKKRNRSPDRRQQSLSPDRRRRSLSPNRNEQRCRRDQRRQESGSGEELTARRRSRSPNRKRSRRHQSSSEGSVERATVRRRSKSRSFERRLPRKQQDSDSDEEWFRRHAKDWSRDQARRHYYRRNKMADSDGDEKKHSRKSSEFGRSRGSSAVSNEKTSRNISRKSPEKSGSETSMQFDLANILLPGEAPPPLPSKSQKNLAKDSYNDGSMSDKGEEDMDISSDIEEEVEKPVPEIVGVLTVSKNEKKDKNHLEKISFSLKSFGKGPKLKPTPGSDNLDDENPSEGGVKLFLPNEEDIASVAASDLQTPLDSVLEKIRSKLQPKLESEATVKQKHSKHSEESAHELKSSKNNHEKEETTKVDDKHKNIYSGQEEKIVMSKGSSSSFAETEMSDKSEEQNKDTVKSEEKTPESISAQSHDDVKPRGRLFKYELLWELEKDERKKSAPSQEPVVIQSKNATAKGQRLNIPITTLGLDYGSSSDEESGGSSKKCSPFKIASQKGSKSLAVSPEKDVKAVGTVEETIEMKDKTVQEKVGISRANDFESDGVHERNSKGVKSIDEIEKATERISSSKVAATGHEKEEKTIKEGRVTGEILEACTKALTGQSTSRSSRVLHVETSLTVPPMGDKPVVYSPSSLSPTDSYNKDSVNSLKTTVHESSNSKGKSEGTETYIVENEVEIPLPKAKSDCAQCIEIPLPFKDKYEKESSRTDEKNETVVGHKVAGKGLEQCDFSTSSSLLTPNDEKLLSEVPQNSQTSVSSTAPLKPHSFAGSGVEMPDSSTPVLDEQPSSGEAEMVVGDTSPPDSSSQPILQSFTQLVESPKPRKPSRFDQMIRSTSALAKGANQSKPAENVIAVKPPSPAVITLSPKPSFSGTNAGKIQIVIGRKVTALKESPLAMDLNDKPLVAETKPEEAFPVQVITGTRKPGEDEPSELIWPECRAVAARETETACKIEESSEDEEEEESSSSSSSSSSSDSSSSSSSSSSESESDEEGDESPSSRDSKRKPSDSHRRDSHNSRRRSRSGSYGRRRRSDSRDHGGEDRKWQREEDDKHRHRSDSDDRRKRDRERDEDRRKKEHEREERAREREKERERERERQKMERQRELERRQRAREERHRHRNDSRDRSPNRGRRKSRDNADKSRGRSPDRSRERNPDSKRADESRDQSLDKNRDSDRTPGRGRGHSQDRSRDHSPDRTRNCSPLRNRFQSPGRARDWSPDRARPRSPLRGMDQSPDRNRRRSPPRSDWSPSRNTAHGQDRSFNQSPGMLRNWSPERGGGSQERQDDWSTPERRSPSPDRVLRAPGTEKGNDWSPSRGRQWSPDRGQGPGQGKAWSRSPDRWQGGGPEWDRERIDGADKTRDTSRDRDRSLGRGRSPDRRWERHCDRSPDWSVERGRERPRDQSEDRYRRPSPERCRGRSPDHSPGRGRPRDRDQPREDIWDRAHEHRVRGRSPGRVRADSRDGSLDHSRERIDRGRRRSRSSSMERTPMKKDDKRSLRAVGESLGYGSDASSGQAAVPGALPNLYPVDQAVAAPPHGHMYTGHPVLPEHVVGQYPEGYADPAAWPPGYTPQPDPATLQLLQQQYQAMGYPPDQALAFAHHYITTQSHHAPVPPSHDSMLMDPHMPPHAVYPAHYPSGHPVPPSHTVPPGFPHGHSAGFGHGHPPHMEFPPHSHHPGYGPDLYPHAYPEGVMVSGQDSQFPYESVAEMEAHLQAEMHPDPREAALFGDLPSAPRPRSRRSRFADKTKEAPESKNKQAATVSDASEPSFENSANAEPGFETSLKSLLKTPLSSEASCTQSAISFKSDQEKDQERLQQEGEGVVSSTNSAETVESPMKEDQQSGSESRPLKVKSRWRRNSEAEAVVDSSSPSATPPPPLTKQLQERALRDMELEEQESTPPPPPPRKRLKMEVEVEQQKQQDEEKAGDSYPVFELITENIHLTERKKSKSMKRMVCDCTTSKVDRAMGIPACGLDCLNRMLMIECGSRCPCLDYCTNKRFQKKQYIKTEPFNVGVGKGWGLKSAEDLPDIGAFVMEYVGELLGYKEFVRRTRQYAKQGMQHHYFMALNTDEVIDATQKGSTSRFMNHSCDPNCETQKWTVNGELRVGFFTKKPVTCGEELTFDYQFEFYGEPQKCCCGTEKCRGYIGSIKNQPAQKKKDKAVEKPEKVFEDEMLDEDIESMMELKEGMQNKNHVLEVCRLMVRAEKPEHRLSILRLIQDTTAEICLRLFLGYHGLPLLWSWMVDVGLGDGEEERMLRKEMLAVLKKLPITNRTILKESKIMTVVEKWANLPPPPPPVECAKDMEMEADTEADSGSEPLPLPIPPDRPVVSILSWKKERKDPKTGKKRVTFAEETASSDSDFSDSLRVSSTNGENNGEGQVTTSESPLVKFSLGEEHNNGDSSGQQDSVSVCASENTETEKIELVSSADESESTSEKEEAGDRTIGDVETGESKQDGLQPIRRSTRRGQKLPSLFDRDEGRAMRRRGRRSNSSEDRNEMADSTSQKEDAADRESKDSFMGRISGDSSAADTGSGDGESSSDGEKTSVDGVQPTADKLETTPVLQPVISGSMVTTTPEPPEIIPVFESVKSETLPCISEANSVTGSDITSDAAPLAKPTEDDDATFSSNGDESPATDEGEDAYTGSSDGPMDELSTMAADLLSGWSELKELYKIPKKQRVEERKRTERELESVMFKEPDRRHEPDPYAKWKKKKADKPKKRDSDDEESKNSRRSIPGPPPGPRMSKEERRQLFEAQVKAEDELAAERAEIQRQQMEALLQQQAAALFYHQDPAFAAMHGLPDLGMLASQGQVMDPNLPFNPGLLTPEQQQAAMLLVSQGVVGPEAALVAQQILAQQNLFQQEQLQRMQGAYAQGQPGQVYRDPAALQQQQLVYQQQMALQQMAAMQQTGQPMPGGEEDDVPPPPSPPKASGSTLPPNWKTARDAEGRLYYYHTVTRQTQWEPPSWDNNSPEDMEFDLPEPEIEEEKRKRTTTTAAADTSSEVAKKIKEQFRRQMSQFVVVYLNPYRKPDCKIGRIVSTEDFKHLARKLTHHVMAKELKHCRHVEDLEVNENVKAKAKDYVRKYMSRYGPVFKTSSSPQLDDFA